MMIVDSGRVRPRSSSTSTGIFASGHSARNAAADASKPKSTSRASNGSAVS